MFLAEPARGFLCRAVILLCFWSAPATAAEWVELDVDGTPVRSILGLPSGPGPHPAVIFNHGTGVRHLGYEASKNQGNMDVSRFTDALVRDGYVALAPIRPFHSDTAYVERGGKVGSEQDWTEVVERGIDTVKAALAYLSARDDVMRDKIGVIGFSEGGNVTLWAAAETRGFAAVVLMSPATIRGSGGYRLRNAAARNRIAAIRAPVFLSLGENDKRSIRKVVTRRLVPVLQDTNEGFEYRLDYPGDHSWFHQLRDDYWTDIAGFLGKHLK